MFASPDGHQYNTEVHGLAHVTLISLQLRWKHAAEQELAPQGTCFGVAKSGFKVVGLVGLGLFP